MSEPHLGCRTSGYAHAETGEAEQQVAQGQNYYCYYSDEHSAVNQTAMKSQRHPIVSHKMMTSLSFAVNQNIMTSCVAYQSHDDDC